MLGVHLCPRDYCLELAPPLPKILDSPLRVQLALPPSPQQNIICYAYVEAANK